jgi:SAM-dependent methyltransferase
MPSQSLRPDNHADWDARLFEKPDGAPDGMFYQQPRMVVHIDDGAIAAARELYRACLPAGGRILDLMSSWRSHLPNDVVYGSVTGQGMNAAEMAANPQLSAYTVQDLNANQILPFETAAFDGAVCTVSVQYLQKPVEVFREVRRVLVPGAPFVLTFSNRCFPGKAVNIWRATDDDTHMRLVALYFETAGGWRDVQMRDCSPAVGDGDPLYAVSAVTSQT